MPASLIRDHRLTEQAFTATEGGKQLPGNDALLCYLKNHRVPGRSKDEISTFRSRGAVTKGFALAFVAYIRTPVIWNDLPSALVELLEPLSDDQRFDILFEELPPSERPKAYEKPNRFNDISAAGYRTFSGLIGKALIDWVLPKRNKTDTSLVHLDPATLEDDYTRVMYTEVGYSQSKKGERLSPREAFDRGVAYLKDDPEFHRDLASTVCSANPDCIRYVVDREGRKIAMTGAHAISNAAMEETLSGNRRPGTYSEEEILPFGNNILIFCVAEVHDSESSESATTVRFKRTAMMAGLLFQIALLIDPDDPAPLRYTTLEIIDSNTTRTRSLGFVPIRDFNEPGKPTLRTVYCDATEWKVPRRYIMEGINHQIRHVRACVDGKYG